MNCRIFLVNCVLNCKFGHTKFGQRADYGLVKGTNRSKSGSERIQKPRIEAHLETVTVYVILKHSLGSC